LRIKELCSLAFEKRKGQFKSLATWMNRRRAQEALPKSPPRVVKSQDIIDKLDVYPDILGGDASIESAKGCHASPEIKYVKEEGTVTGVEIKCACGEEVILRFDYDVNRK